MDDEGQRIGAGIAHAAPDHRLERLTFFSDAVFAIAITLLIIEIHPPHLPHDASDAAWGHALVALLPHIAAFVLSFLVIGAMWVQHHALFSLPLRFDRRLMWPNLLLLLAVGFLPFSTGVVAVGSEAAVPYAFYAASLLVAAALKAWVVGVALGGDRAAAVPAAEVRLLKRRRWVMPAVTALTALLAFVAPGWNMMALALLSIVPRLPGFRMVGDAGGV